MYNRPVGYPRTPGLTLDDDPPSDGDLSVSQLAPPQRTAYAPQASLMQPAFTPMQPKFGQAAPIYTPHSVAMASAQITPMTARPLAAAQPLAPQPQPQHQTQPQALQPAHSAGMQLRGGGPEDSAPAPALVAAGTGARAPPRRPGRAHTPAPATHAAPAAVTPAGAPATLAPVPTSTPAPLMPAAATPAPMVQVAPVSASVAPAPTPAPAPATAAPVYGMMGQTAPSPRQSIAPPPTITPQRPFSLTTAPAPAPAPAPVPAPAAPAPAPAPASTLSASDAAELLALREEVRELRVRAAGVDQAQATLARVGAEVKRLVQQHADEKERLRAECNAAIARAHADAEAAREAAAAAQRDLANAAKQLMQVSGHARQQEAAPDVSAAVAAALRRGGATSLIRDVAALESQAAAAGGRVREAESVVNEVAAVRDAAARLETAMAAARGVAARPHPTGDQSIKDTLVTTSQLLLTLQQHVAALPSVAEAEALVARAETEAEAAAAANAEVEAARISVGHLQTLLSQVEGGALAVDAVAQLQARETARASGRGAVIDGLRNDAQKFCGWIYSAVSQALGEALEIREQLSHLTAPAIVGGRNEDLEGSLGGVELFEDVRNVIEAAEQAAARAAPRVGRRRTEE